MIKISSSQTYVLKFRLPTNSSLASSLHCSPVSNSIEDLQTLGLTENATKAEIKAAYFTKAKQFHPDSSTSGSQGSAEFQKLNEAYKRLMYESKFTGKNSPQYQDPWAQRYQGYNNRNYRNPDPRNYSHGAQNPFSDGFENFKNKDPRSYRYRNDNPFSDGYNDQNKDRRSYRYRQENPWANPWERMNNSNQTEKPELSKAQQEILRRAMLQIFFGFILAQMLIFHILRRKDQFAHPQYNYTGGGGCMCAMCLERRQQVAQQQQQQNLKT